MPIVNLDGTTNDDFRIGKKGPRIRQGEATPTSGVDGDLYLQHGTAETARLWHRRNGVWRQLADQAYADGVTMYETDGSLTSSRVITGAQGKNFSIITYDTDPSSYNRGQFILLNSLVGINLTHAAGDGLGGSTGIKRLLLTPTVISFTDTIDSKGVIYSHDYSANYTARSLIDKEYVDTLDQYAVVGYSLAGVGSVDDIYVAGHYDASAAHHQFWWGDATATHGTAGNMQGAHAFFVASGAGDSGSVLTVTGTSINDAGIRITSDSEILVADASTLSTDDYVETTKRWLGQITYTISGPGGGTVTGNYGFAAYETFGDRDFTVKDFKADGYGGATTTDVDFQLIHHSSAGWTYHATAFQPGGTVLASAAADVSTDGDFVDGGYFHYERVGLSTAISGSSGDGIVIRYTAAAADSLRFANVQLGYLMAATT